MDGADELGGTVTAASDTLRQALRDGGSIVGTFVKLPSREAIEIVSLSGFDFAVVDLEHSQLDEAVGRSLISHAFAMGFPAVARLPSVDPPMINRLLEAGAAGIQLSNIQNPRETEQLIESCRYSPHGRRSISLSQSAAAYGSVSMNSYLEASRPGPLLVGQIESPDLPDPMVDLVRGLDVTFVGSSDLSLELGRPGTFDEVVIAKIREIATASQEAGTYFGGWLPSSDLVPILRDAGGTYFVIGADLPLLRSSLSAVCSEARSEFVNPPLPLDTTRPAEG